MRFSHNREKVVGLVGLNFKKDSVKSKEEIEGETEVWKFVNAGHWGYCEYF